MYFVLNIYKQLLASEVHIHLLHMYDTWFMLIINRTIVKRRRSKKMLIIQLNL